MVFHNMILDPARRATSAHPKRHAYHAGHSTLGRMTMRGFAMTAALALLAAIGSGPSPAKAEYPERPIRLVVPYAAGGSSDIVGRLFAERLEKKLGQPVVIENAGGAGGAVGAQRVVAAEADGYTLLIGSGSEILIRKLLQPTPYDGLKDLSSIAMIGTGPMVLVGKPLLSAAALPDVLALAKAKPDTLSYGSAGAGTFMHLVGEAVKSHTSTQIRHVAYRGAAPLMTDVIAGHVELGVASLASALPFIKGGQARAYAISSSSRVAFAPDIPALAEFPGLGGFELDLWIGLFGPAKLPAAIVDRLRTATDQILDDPGLKAKLSDQAIVTRKLSGPDLATFLLDANEKYRTIIRDGAIRIE
ncbi:MAG: tripartite tricarboxylate transporter substrate binding protein [Bosea sp.]|nr:tripartite tricarboxylate transporter substrate binding protein [Bosea sp. (in: a-proteobacteria)]MCP4737808.1 tripartite tricarboxylate transporter substrate binding protein [Bosea sp. (in: a-proteobacteria)]